LANLAMVFLSSFSKWIFLCTLSACLWGSHLIEGNNSVVSLLKPLLKKVTPYVLCFFFKAFLVSVGAQIEQ
jgi:hypothetical protein